MTSLWECPNCEHTPASVRDTQIYLPSKSITGGYETDSSWDLNPDSDVETTVDVIEDESEDDTSATVVVRRKPKANLDGPVSGGSQMSFADVGRRFTATLKSAHMPM